MRKIKAFGCIVLVIASMIVFSLVNVPTEAITYPPTFTEFYKNQEDYPNLELVDLECLDCYVSHHYINRYAGYAVDTKGTIRNPNNGKVIRIQIMIDILTQTGVKSIRHEMNRDLNSGETTSLNLGSGTESLPIDLKNLEVLGLMETPKPTPTPTPEETPTTPELTESATEHLKEAIGILEKGTSSLASVPRVPSGAYSTSEDLEYIEWHTVTNEKIGEDVKLITAEMEKGIFSCDWTYVRTLETALTEIDQFEVSPELEPIKKEEELFLLNSKWVAHYIENAEENIRYGHYGEAADNFHDARVYSEVSSTHLYNMKALIEALPTPSPTPTPKNPGYEAIFAISSFLAVAYLALRRKK